MSIINQFLSDNINYVVISIIAIISILLITTISLLITYKKLNNRYKKFMKKISNEDIEGLLNSYLNKVEVINENSEITKKATLELNSKVDKCVQKVSIYRYKAFEDIGSDLSYSIAMLDYKDDGVILTGLYGRNDSTTFAKPIIKGISRYELSDEEKHVLNNAITSKN